MSDDRTIVIPLCRMAQSGKSTFQRATRTNEPSHEWSESDRTLTISLPNPKKADAHTIEIEMKPLGQGDPYTCGELEPCIYLERDPEYDNPFAEEPEIIRMSEYAYIGIRLHGHCAWREILLTAHKGGNPPGGQFLHAIRAEDPGCPPREGDICDGYDGEGRHDILSNAHLAPGMQVNARQIFRDGPGTITDVCGMLWYHTCSMTGGTVLAVEGEYDKIGIRYTVEAEGVVLEGVRPSDFVTYAPGDWVFLVPMNDPCKMDCERGDGLLPAPEEAPEGATHDWTPDPIDGSAWMIVPFKIGDRGA